MIVIVDYGMGNIHSVQKALETLGAKTIVSHKPEDVNSADKIVLPGVGAFDDAMLELEKQGLIDPLKDYIGRNRPFLGICLGMQILFEASEEAVLKKGLGIFKGAVKKFIPGPKLKVPHMGWNQLRISHIVYRLSQGSPLLKDVKDEEYVYFCHSYYPEPAEKDIIIATTDYGGEFASVVGRGNVFGVQFHPEKSQETGLKILKNFIAL